MSAISEWSQVITKGSVMKSTICRSKADSPWSFVSVFFSILQPLLLVLVWNDNQGRKDSVMTGVHRELAIIDIWTMVNANLVFGHFYSSGFLRYISSDSQMLHEELVVFWLTLLLSSALQLTVPK